MAVAVRAREKFAYNLLSAGHIYLICDFNCDGNFSTLISDQKVHHGAKLGESSGREPRDYN